MKKRPRTQSKPLTWKESNVEERYLQQCLLDFKPSKIVRENERIKRILALAGFIFRDSVNILYEGYTLSFELKTDTRIRLDLQWQSQTTMFPELKMRYFIGISEETGSLPKDRLPPYFTGEIYAIYGSNISLGSIRRYIETLQKVKTIFQ